MSAGHLNGDCSLHVRAVLEVANPAPARTSVTCQP